MSRIGEIDNNPIAAKSEKRDKRFKKAWTEYTYLVNYKLKKASAAGGIEHLAVENLSQTHLTRPKLKATSQNRRKVMPNQKENQSKTAMPMATAERHRKPAERTRSKQKEIIQPIEMQKPIEPDLISQSKMQRTMMNAELFKAKKDRNSSIKAERNAATK